MGEDAGTCPPLPDYLPLSGVDGRASLPADLGLVAIGVGRRVEARNLK